MEITELAGTRFETAMALFAEGGSLLFAGVYFRLLSPDTLECRVESSWSMESVTEDGVGS